GEYRSEDFEPFNSRNEHAKPFARVGNILATKTQHDAGDWRGTDLGKGRETEGGLGFCSKSSQCVRLFRADYCTVGGGRAGLVTESKFPAFGSFVDGLDGRCQAKRIS